MARLAACTVLLGFASAQDLFLAQREFSPPGNATDADVIIIGAGWAGMTAAHTLHQKNVKFLVLEATAQTGGRSHAAQIGHESVGKFTVELGSNWLCGYGGGNAGQHGKPSKPKVNPVVTLAERAGLKTSFVPGSSANQSTMAIFDADGKNADPTGKLRQRANAVVACLNKTAQSGAPDINVRDAIKGCGWTPKSEVEWALDWFLTVDDPGFVAKRQSLKATYPDESYMWWGDNDRFVIDQRPRGYALLIDELVKDSVPPGDSRVHLGAWVNKIEYDCSGVKVSTQDGKSFTAKEVISTLPVGVLKHKHQELFSPALPAKHAEILSDGIIMGNLTHVVLQFPTVWWDNSLPLWISANKDIASNKAGEFIEWQNLNHASRIPGSQILLSFVGGQTSSKFEAMNQADRLSWVMSRLRAQNPGKTIPDPVDSIYSYWSADPLSYGAYSGFEMGWKDHFFNTLTKPLKACKEPRVRFAGEGMCDDLSGFTHGGYQSGLEVASQYLYEVGKGKKPSKEDSLSLCSW